ncbi:MAG: M14 family metallopeptidase [Candidatus Aminicenantes bacterium]|nr:M14 family metallopeptidase [Candidatus Aminicenantes bacterium]
MSQKKHKIIFSLTVLFLVGTLVQFSPLSGQNKLQKSPGGYHGELDFSISWKQYYSYAEWTKIMHDIQKQYSHLADIESIGKSRMGRDQYLITITSKSTGPHAEKTAMWVDGAVHGNEVNGITCSLYLMWYLLTRYDYDPYIHDLVDSFTFYILPGLNVDANESFVVHPNTPNNPREPFRPEDNDGDGLYDEDQTEDVDGDGELSIMYIEDSKGDYKLSPDKRQFIPITDPREEVRRFRRIGDEGYDNDGDGRINEDDIGGPDPNRNYPYGWSLPDGNPYPMSEPCTRNVFEFQLAHPNIFASFHYHNTGRLIMFQAPPAVRSRNQDPQMQERMRERMEQQLVEMRKTNKYAQMFDRQVAPDDQQDMDVQTEIASAGARILKNYTPVIGGLSGQANAATYYMLGAYSYLIELWGTPAFDADMNDDGRVTDEEYLEWIDMDLNGEGWINPHKVNHPDLGEIWIGGTPKKHLRRTPPARYIEQEAFKNSQFVLYCASQFPRVEITDITVNPVSDKLLWVEVTVKNDRVYPTYSDRTAKLKRAGDDTIVMKTSSGIKHVEMPKGITVIDPFDSKDSFETITADGASFRLKGKETKRFCALVEWTGSKGWVEVSATSKFGGTAKKRIVIQKN